MAPIYDSRMAHRADVAIGDGGRAAERVGGQDVESFGHLGYNCGASKTETKSKR